MKIQPGRHNPNAGSGVSGTAGGSGDQVAVAVDALREIDRQQARLLRAIAIAEPAGGVPASRLISLAANATGWDVAFLDRAVDTLGAMPATWAAFEHGRLSWSQLRGIVLAAKPLRVEDRELLDARLAAAIAKSDTAEPEWIVDTARDLADRLDELARQDRERAETAQAFIRFQPDLLGGVDFWGRTDDETAATLQQALDAAADSPVSDDQEPLDADGKPVPKAWRRSTARGAQLIEGLRRIAAAYQPNGAHGRTAMTVIADLQSLTGHDAVHGASPVTSRILWNLAGGRRSTSTARVAMLACDSTRRPVLTDTEQIIAVGDAHAIINRSMRTALTARDQGCRFPGCPSPAAHADAHHVIFREQGGATELANLVLLCRPCHRLVHRHGWSLTLHQDGGLTVRRGRYHFTSRPPLTPPPFISTPVPPPGPGGQRGHPPDRSPPDRSPSDRSPSDRSPPHRSAIDRHPPDRDPPPGAPLAGIQDASLNHHRARHLEPLPF